MKAQSATTAPYQSATNGIESSAQWNAYAVAPNAPATTCVKIRIFGTSTTYRLWTAIILRNPC
jgi:hypothetical protein